MLLFRKTSGESLRLLTARPAVKKMRSDGTGTHWYRSDKWLNFSLRFSSHHKADPHLVGCLTLTRTEYANKNRNIATFGSAWKYTAASFISLDIMYSHTMCSAVTVKFRWRIQYISLVQSSKSVFTSQLGANEIRFESHEGWDTKQWLQMT